MALSPCDHSSHAITRWVGQSDVVGVDVFDLIDSTVNVEVVVVDVVRKGRTPRAAFSGPSWDDRT